MQNMVVVRARSAVGTRFRVHGRKPETGLDCVGLALHAFGMPLDLGRCDYRLRGDHLNELDETLRQQFRRVARTRVRAGDLVAFHLTPDQLHLAIWCGTSFVHADAAIGKVVETPLPHSWALTRAFRLRQRKVI